MRMRKKKWAEPELKLCTYYISNINYINKPSCDIFRIKQPIHLELGCGKGVFTSTLAANNKNTNYIALDLNSDVLAVCRRNIESEYAKNNTEIDNIFLVRCGAEKLLDFISYDDDIRRIYINFCNPWCKKKHNKRRLTYPSFLDIYSKILKRNSEIFFKTDDDELFEDSIYYFKDSKFNIERISYDLHAENYEDESKVLTEHEIMFSEKGKKIKFLEAKLMY